MKKLAIIILATLPFISLSQDLSFEETVKYIEDFFTDYRASREGNDEVIYLYNFRHKNAGIFYVECSISFNGKVNKEFKGELDTFDGSNKYYLEPALENERTSIGLGRGLLTGYEIDPGGRRVNITEKLINIPFKSIKDKERIVKAFLHLQKVYKDPFDD